jgi:hypothetical protein
MGQLRRIKRKEDALFVMAGSTVQQNVLPRFFREEEPDCPPHVSLAMKVRFSLDVT